MSAKDKEELHMSGEKKAFIQEQIVPKKRSKTKRFFGYVLSVSILAIVFGIVGSFVFTIMGSHFKKMLGKEDKDIIVLSESPTPTAKAEPAPSPTKEPEKKKEEPEAITIDRIKEAYHLLTNEAKEYNRFIVTVSGVVNGVDWFDNPSEHAAAACGIIIADNEDSLFILTTNDRIKDASSIRISFIDERKAEASLYGTDKETNLAVLAVQKDELKKETLEQIQIAELGESYYVSEGIPVFSLGSPNGYMYSIEFGMISGGLIEEYVTDNKIELFNTNMNDNPNGEGVIVNLDGKVLGIITHNYDKGLNSNLCTAIGISRLRPIIERMINQEQQAYFGVVANDIPEENKKKLEVEEGIYITDVKSNSPALEAGLKSGDIIVEVNGEEMTSVLYFNSMLTELKPKEKVKVTVIRTSLVESKKINTEVTLGKR